eukprot:CAMPEP_0119124926 /NCGR_PEP_ID=MMETSP1310-20130426/4379_1 /TAXON_ID=464262 /ORGANISM="Genus nov. species nov., Strain RCC2339" /LENGTH=495 /DNA_ID=CAMNT_0007114939 /DNA_START=175 /DNA_END=1662 /DNA_ORIENTATION=+
MVEARDGVTLHTVVQLPSVSPPGEKFTAVLIRTPYGAKGLSPADLVFLPTSITKDAVLVSQDMRGRMESRGQWNFFRNDTTDGEDTLRWITSQAWSDGRVITYGRSADGIGAYLLSRTPSPPSAVVASVVMFGTADLFSVCFGEGGLYRESLVEQWHAKLGEGTAPVRENERFGPWWSANSPDHGFTRRGGVTPPTVHLTGWYDIFVNGAIQAYEGSVGTQAIIINQGGHCHLGEDYTGFETKLVEREVSRILNAKGSVSKRIAFFLMGFERNRWVCQAFWPPKKSVHYYLTVGGNLLPSLPQRRSYQSFLYDPDNPAPTLGGNNLFLACGPRDHGLWAERSDVLFYAGEGLTSPQAVVGEVRMSLEVASSQADTDFIVMLLDVSPTGTLTNILDDGVRMRWRNGQVKSEPLTPHKPVTVSFSLGHTAYLFGPGHKIAVFVTSSNYPRFSANPNTGDPLLYPSTPRVANNTVYHSRFTKISLPFVDTKYLRDCRL